MIESTGTSGRLPVLSCHVKLAQSTVQVTRNTWPGVAGVLPLKPPTPAYPTAGLSAVFMLLGSKATSRIGRFGRALLPSVTFVQIDWLEPVPMLRPIWTLPSFVPTIASDHVAGSANVVEAGSRSSVRKKPGSTRVVLIPNGATSGASDSIQPSTPNFAAA